MFVTALLAVSLAAPVPKVKAKADYWPRQVGDTWVYEADGREVTQEVTQVAEEDGGTRVTVTITAKRERARESEYVVKGGSVFHTADGGKRYDPAVRRLALELKAGEKWEWRMPPGGPVAPWAGEIVAGEEEEVTVPAGTFTAVPLVWTVAEVEGKAIAKPMVYTYWYARGVGMVKSKYDGGGRVLKSFTPGKDAKK